MFTVTLISQMLLTVIIKLKLFVKQDICFGLSLVFWHSHFTR